ncbi:RNA recognition motif-containing protein [Mucilaginibacter gracilis]|uniref:RNA recognition motif-containing protein n=1 Tax=Mucilaginibacter gracilis TaxID=423350 RepID=A0A495J4U2_9SPHI|nr:hypothetical protein [Mucilaginibacter gracilis]RKR83977.1 RNA recognition motif-containing protein [Mucilaginibacter gracilis]
MFSIHGTVNTVTIVTDRLSGESKGYGFITMTDDTGAARANEAFHGASIDDGTISVRFAEDKSSKPVLKKPPVGLSGSPRRDNQTEKPKRPRRPLQPGRSDH